MERELTRRTALRLGTGTILAGIMGVSLAPVAHAAVTPAGRSAGGLSEAATAEAVYPPAMATRTFGTLRTSDWSTTPIRFRYAGTAVRRFPDKSKKNAPTTAKVHVFTATWLRSTTEVLVSAALTKAAAEKKARKHVFALGRVPHFVRRSVKEMRIYAGVHAATALNGVISIYEGAHYPAHRWPNVYLHESAHCLNEKVRADADLSAAWRRAVAADKALPHAALDGFISEYAHRKPPHEDFGESLVSWLAVRFHPDRLAEQAPGAYEFIQAQIPHRIRFFEAQNWDTAPLR